MKLVVKYFCLADVLLLRGHLRLRVILHLGKYSMKQEIVESKGSHVLVT